MAVDQGESPETTAAVRGYARSLFDRASARRLEAAWAELDAQREAEWGEGVTDEGKTYSCKHCGKTLASPPLLAAHVRHVHGGKRKAPRGRRGVRASVNGGVPCPMCCQALPGTVGVLADQFKREGLEEDVALRCATLAWAGLRVP